VKAARGENTETREREKSMRVVSSFVKLSRAEMSAPSYWRRRRCACGIKEMKIVCVNEYVPDYEWSAANGVLKKSSR